MAPVGGNSRFGSTWGVAADLTQLMREIDGGYIGDPDRALAGRYWREYVAPEIERLFAPDVAFHSHLAGPDGRTLYSGYDGLREWADDVERLFSRFERENSDWQPLGADALLDHQCIRALGRESGAEIELSAWILWLLDRSRVREIRTFADRYEAEAAAGPARLASG